MLDVKKLQDMKTYCLYGFGQNLTTIITIYSKIVWHLKGMASQMHIIALANIEQKGHFTNLLQRGLGNYLFQL